MCNVARSGSKWLEVARNVFFENAHTFLDGVMGATVVLLIVS